MIMEAGKSQEAQWCSPSPKAGRLEPQEATMFQAQRQEKPVFQFKGC